MDAGELGAHLDPQLQVEVRQRLVHQERPWLAHQRAAQGDPLHLAARHLRRVAVEQLLDVQQLGHALELGVDLALGQLARPQRRRDVLRRRLLRVERVALEHHREVTLGRGGLRRVDPVQEHVADVGRLEPGQDAQRRRLARARRTEQDEERALGDVELEVLERLDLAERLRDPFRHDRAAHALTTFSVVGSYAGGAAPTWRTATTCSSSKRAVAGMRTWKRPALHSTT